MQNEITIKIDGDGREAAEVLMRELWKHAEIKSISMTCSIGQEDFDALARERDQARRERDTLTAIEAAAKNLVARALGMKEPPEVAPWEEMGKKIVELRREQRVTEFGVEIRVYKNSTGGLGFHARAVYGDLAGDGVATSKEAAIGYAILGLGQDLVRDEDDQPIDTGSGADVKGC